MPLFLATFHVTTTIETPVYAATQDEADAWMRAHAPQVIREDLALAHEADQGHAPTYQGCERATTARVQASDLPTDACCWGPAYNEMILVSEVWPRDRRKARYAARDARAHTALTR